MILGHSSGCITSLRVRKVSNDLGQIPLGESYPALGVNLERDHSGREVWKLRSYAEA